MFAIDDPTAAASLPTPEVAGTPGYWTEGNPGTGVPATYVRASFLNMLQGELLNILAAASVTPSKTTYNQLLTSLNTLYKGRLLRTLIYTRIAGVQNVSINGGTPTTTGASTYVPSSGMSFSIAEAQGGGSGGAGCTKPSAGNLSAGAPGVSGSYAKGYFSAASVGASQAITVGAKGIGVLGATGNAGGTSSVGSLLTAPGGPIGATFQNSFAVASQYFGNGLTATAPTGGNLLALIGTSGLPTTILNGGIGNGTQGGAGGYTPYGVSTAGTAINTVIPAASYYGQGGYGAVITSAYGSASIAGGDGGEGIVTITEYA